MQVLLQDVCTSQEMTSSADGICRERAMSSYAKYCRDQAAECARRVKLANSPEVAATCRNLGLRWLKLAQKADLAGQPLSAIKKERPAIGAR